MKIDEAIEIITNAVQTDKMTVEQDEALAIVQREIKKRIPQKPIFGYDEQDDICCSACCIEIAAMDDYEYEKKQYKCCPNCGQKINWEE